MKKILVVESSKLITQHLKKEIEANLAFEVLLSHTFADGKQWIDTEKEPFFAAILGLRLPGAMDGEMVDYARMHHIPTIVFTGTDSAETRKKILAKQVVDYVLKDSLISIQQVVQQIDRLQKNASHKILVVDNSKASCQYIAHHLKLHQYQVFQANDGIEALEILAQEEEITLVITDFDMPKMDGLELTKNIRAKIPNKEDIAIIGLSTHGNADIAPRFLKNGANDSINKPFLIEEFYCRITQNIEVIENTRQLKKFYEQENAQKQRIKLAFCQYLSPKVVDILLQSPEKLALGGESREMTVFFSDLVGFTITAERMKPEQLVEFLNAYLSDMCDIILEYDGTVDKFVGDAIMAFWGAPLHQPTHAEQACFAALDMQQHMTLLRRVTGVDSASLGGIRMGINSGPMVVGNMGSKQRMDYTTIGDSVNLAARLEGANKLYATDILLSHATYNLAKESIEARALDTVQVIGKKEIVTIYHLLGRKGKVSDLCLECIQLFHHAREAYKNRDFTEALHRFEKILHINPNDGPSQLFQSRCQTFLQTPPPADWDGVFRLTSKR